MTGLRLPSITSIRPMAALLIVVAAAMSAGACQKEEAPVRASIVAIPECPGDGFRVTIKDGRNVTTITQLPLVGNITDIPEFHDCQRFIKADGSYDNRYAIFAIAGLDSLARHWSNDSAHADSAGTSGVRISRTAAVILSFGGSYPQLAIEPGFNCLLLYRDAGHQWQATMLHQGANPKCPDMVTGDAPADVGLPLLTKPPLTPRPQYLDADYPAVARWDWDSTNMQQYISIKCGVAWCEIGNRDGFVARPGMTATATFPSNAGPVTPATHRTRTVEVGGWHDLQELSVVATSGGVQPGAIHGAVIPAKSLGRYNNPADFHPSGRNPWVVSAYAMMDADYINSKVQLRRGLNTISLCYGDRAACRVPDANLPAKCKTGTWTWWAKTQSAGAADRYTCVTQTTHPGYDIPAAARWRWDETDETMWIRCTQGCCKLEG